MSSYNKYFLQVFKTQYADFSTVATRTQYWMFQLWGVLTFIAIVIVAAILLTALQSLAIFAGLIYFAFAIGIIVPSLAMSVRRLHDRNLSGWMFLLHFVPFGGIYLFVMSVMDSVKEGNRFGYKESSDDSKDVEALRKEVEELKKSL